MTVCRDRRRRVLAAPLAVCLAAGLLLAGTSAWAQSPPAALTPGPDTLPPAAAGQNPAGDPTAPGTNPAPENIATPTRPVGRPLVLSPLPRSLSPAPRGVGPQRELQRFVTPGAATQPAALGATGGSSRSIVAVEVDTLDEIDSDSVGVLDAGNGGFGAGLWRGTSRELVERLLPLVPAGQHSPALRNLTVRLLLTRATAPQGKRGKKSLLSIRVDRLLALGDVRGAVRLLRVGSIPEDDQDMSYVEVESRFVDNDNAGACQKVRSVGRRFTQPYWQQALSYCLALAGELERSSMIADILRERSDGKDTTFFALVDSLGGQGGLAVDSLRDPQGLHLSMMRAANRKLPADVLETQNLAILRTAAFSPNADFDLRLQAVERLIVVGAATPAELVDLYANLPQTGPAAADPVKAATAAWGPTGRALLVKAILRTRDPTAKVALLRKSWAIARKRGGLPIMNRVSIPLLLGIKPSEELMRFADEIGRLLLAHGQVKAALGWFKVVSANAATDPKAQKVADALWPLVQLAVADDTTAVDPARLQAWWAGLNRARSKTAAKTAATTYRLLEALGKTIDPASWAALVGRPGAQAGPAPDTALWRALTDASGNGRVGETVIYTLIALGPKGVSASDPAAIVAVVAALKKAGLEAEARALAVEAAIAAGA